MQELRPRELKVSKNCAEKNKLSLQEGDVVTILDSAAECFYWRGQNRSSTEVGQFPQSCLERAADRDFISQPIKYSFIHTGPWRCRGAAPMGGPVSYR
ncbi:hypothetical protein EB796_007563 [Bugula neritina]|uniref:SH3 domain-containing protein n=1 Tax=Bugula neritina TaxID=10212 RepID=A0A7J7K7F2_BUGNE|nr:hypothetical protein EB796_007563 [Bugula neritina]